MIAGTFQGSPCAWFAPGGPHKPDVLRTRIGQVGTCDTPSRLISLSRSRPFMRL